MLRVLGARGLFGGIIARETSDFPQHEAASVMIDVEKHEEVWLIPYQYRLLRR